MSEFFDRLAEAASGEGPSKFKPDPKDSSVLIMPITAGRTLGAATAYIDEDYAEPTDAAAALAFAAELGRRVDAAGLQRKGKFGGFDCNRAEDWDALIDLEGKNGLAVEFRVTADRKTGKITDIRILAIGPDASSDLPSNDPLLLHTKKTDLLDAFEEAASVAKGHAEDVRDFRKFDPDFGKY